MMQLAFHLYRGKRRLTSHAVEINVHDLKVYRQILLGGSVAAGETYMQGDWDVNDLTKLIEIIIKNSVIHQKLDGKIARLLDTILRSAFRITKTNNISQAKKNIIAHYDLGNEFSCSSRSNFNVFVRDF